MTLSPSFPFVLLRLFGLWEEEEEAPRASPVWTVCRGQMPVSSRALRLGRQTEGLSSEERAGAGKRRGGEGGEKKREGRTAQGREGRRSRGGRSRGGGQRQNNTMARFSWVCFLLGKQRSRQTSLFPSGFLSKRGVFLSSFVFFYLSRGRTEDFAAPSRLARCAEFSAKLHVGADSTSK